MRRKALLSLYLSLIVVLGIVVLVNVLSYRFYRRVDFTKNRIHTLSQQTLKVLSSLKDRVDIIGFYRESDDRKPSVKDLMDSYMSHSKLIHFRFVDPDKEPMLAKKYNVDMYGTLVFCSGKKRISINPLDVPTEEDITNAIIRVTREKKKRIYFLEGHGEHDINDTSPGGYYQACRALEDRGFLVDSLLLPEKGGIPKDASLVIVSGPRRRFLKGELRMLYGFWEKGGSLMFMLDPGFPDGIARFIKDKWGVEYRRDVVVDPASKLFGGNPLAIFVSDYMDNPINGNFKYVTIFPLACSLSYSPMAKLSYKGLMRTGKGAWGETDTKSEVFKFNKGKDYEGPLVLGYLVTREGKKGMAVFLGDSDFPCNSFISASGNRDLFLSIVSYLTKEKDLVSITPKREDNTPLYLTGTQSKALFIVSIVVIPFIFILTGAIIFFRRRRL